MTNEQEYLYDNSNVYQNEMSYDVEVENTIYQGSLEVETNHFRPFSQGSLRTEKKKEYKESLSLEEMYPKEVKRIKEHHKIVNNIIL
jgi:hypothetical protein